MARARLHIICGNCGCNDSFEFKHVEAEFIEEEKINNETTWITCKNCSTIHDLADNAEFKEK